MRVAARALCLLVVTALAVPGVARAASSLGATHLGVRVDAPPAPQPGGAPATAVTTTWLRCTRYRQLVEADGATNLWPLGDAGLVAADAIGNAPGAYASASHGVAADGALAGEQEAASSFDGNRDVVSVGAASASAGLSPYTFEAWVRPTAVEATPGWIFVRETTSAPRDGTGVWLSSAGLGFERWSAGTRTAITLASGLPVGRWSLVTASFDGGTMRLYVDGRLIGSRATDAPLAQTSVPLLIGSRFAGDLDQASLTPAAVPRAHVAARAAAGTTPPCTPIDGATTAAYTPVGADVGHMLRVVVAASNASGTETVTSDGEGPTDDDGRLSEVSLTGIADGATVSGVVPVVAVPTGMPGARIEFAVDGVVRYAKPAEAPYRYTWYTAAEGNGAHTVTVSLWGPGSASAAVATAHVRVSNPTAYGTPLPFGKESMYALFNEGDPASANNLLDDVWPARGYPLPHLQWPLTWTEDPYDDAYWRFYFYGMQPLPTLLYEWKQTGDHRYLDRLVAILRSYVAYDRVRGADVTRFDNNHAAAYRAMALVNFDVKLSRDGVLPGDLASGLLASISKLGTFLADPHHFEADYNHGFNEGAALLLIADNFPQLAGADDWRTTALARLQQMLANTIDPDGVEVENSPFYHVYVLGLVYQIAKWAEAYEPALAPAYSAAAQRMLGYAAEITQPNGYLPMLGATATTYMPSQDPTVYGPMAAADAGFRWAYTRGASGSPPPDGAVLFPVSGLFVLRSPLVSQATRFDQTYVTFNAGTYRTSHSDLDALGVTLYSNGSTLLPTSGLFTYTEQPDFDYFHGTRSDNTVVVDGQNQPPGSARAGSYGSSGGSVWASGTSDLYGGVHHRRTVVVLRQGLALVADRLSGTIAHTYTQTWHLAPDASVDVAGDDAYVSSAAGARTLTIRQADPAGETLTAVRGQTTPVLQGWYSSTYAFKQPAWALEVARHGTSAGFTTLLAAGPYAAEPSTVVISPAAAGDRVDVCVNGTIGYSVILPDDPAAAVDVSGGACPAAVVPAAVVPGRAPLPAPSLTLSPADLAGFNPLAARANAIPVLLFHSVCATTGCSSYNMTPTEFARTLLMIQRAGFHTISIADYAAWWEGRAVSLPTQPILVTFDDGRLDSYRGTDAVLEALHDRATMFDVTGWTETRNPKFLFYEELARMAATGRWDVQLHGGQGHTTVEVAVGAGGAPTTGAFYAWRRYDEVRYPNGDHMEPYADWKLRAEGDIRQAEAALEARVPGMRPLAFAVPFGDYGQYRTNDPAIPPELSSFLHARFGVFFVQGQSDPDFTTPGALPHRYTIESTTTADDVYAWLARHSQ